MISRDVGNKIQESYWNQTQEQFSRECVLITAVFAYGNKFLLILKRCAKNCSVLGGFQVKNHIFSTKIDCYCMNNCSEITIITKKELICEFILANPPISKMVLY